MNQTQKRLSIIKMAISMTDIETIQQQISKLRLLKDDAQVQKIIEALDTESYAQAQNLIQEYIDKPVQEVHQRVSDTQQEQQYTKREQELIDEFDLFVSDTTSETPHELIDIDQYMRSSASSSKKEDDLDFDRLLEIDKNDLRAEKIEDENEKVDEFFDIEKEDTLVTPSKEKNDEDSFFDNEEEIAQDTPVEQITEVETKSEPQEITSVESTDTTESSEQDAKEEVEQPTPKETSDPLNEKSRYRPIFSIKQQFLDASGKYHMLEQSTMQHSSVNTWMNQISNQRGYTKKEVEEIVRRAMKLAQSNINHHKSEAAELILLSGLTEDEFGQLILAREFYKGELFARNIPEAFKRIELLASKEFPEAICDLAQFIEHGIGSTKNKKKAKELYEQAMHLGIKRAQKHFERLKKEGRFFSF